MTETNDKKKNDTQILADVMHTNNEGRAHGRGWIATGLVGMSSAILTSAMIHEESKNGQPDYGALVDNQAPAADQKPGENATLPQNQAKAASPATDDFTKRMYVASAVLGAAGLAAVGTGIGYINHSKAIRRRREESDKEPKARQ